MTTTPTTSIGPGAAPGPIERVEPAPPPPVRPRRRSTPGLGTGLGVGTAVLYLSLIVLIPLGAVVWRSGADGSHGFWAAITTPDSWSALKLTVIASAIVALINMVMGTIIAWVLVRDRFPGKGIVDMLIDLPFALPTIVAGLV